MARKSRRERIQPRAIVVFWVVVALVAVAIFLALNAMGGNISTHSATFTRENVQVIVIRDEMLLSSDAFGKIMFKEDEGTVVQEGQKIAEVYKFNYNEHMMQDLLSRQQEIYRYQVGTVWKDVVNADLSEKESAINEKLDEISNALLNPRKSDVLQLSRDLEKMLEERKSFLKTSTQPDIRLQELYNQEQEHLTNIESAIEDVRAVSSGMISFNTDEYSAILNTQNLPRLTAADVQGIWDRKSISQLSSAQEERSLYRLANPNRFYLAVRTATRDNYHMHVGSTYDVDFGLFHDEGYKAKVIYATRGNNSVYILQIDADITPFLDLRRTEVSLSGTFSGLSAPADALRTESGIEGIIIQSGNVMRFVPVDVLCDDGGTIIFECDDPEVQQGVRVVKR